VNKDFNSWYEENFHKITDNGIWMRGGELNTLSNIEYENRSYRILIARLSTYWDTADSFTHKLLYQLVTDHLDMYADLSYLPSVTDAQVFDFHEVPWIIGTSSKRGALQFDMIAFSNSIVQELVNIPIMLRKSGIPIKKQERLLQKEVPLIILGGANALYTSALSISDPIVDGIFVGEDPALIKELFTIAHDGKLAGRSKQDVLEKMETLQGFYQPDKRKSTVKFTPATIPDDQLLRNAPVMYTEEQMGTGNLQISEGCPAFCSFCAESWGRKPYRELSIEKIRSAASEMKASMGLETLELYSFNFNMHREFYTILKDMTAVFSSIGLKSQRFDTIAKEPELVKCLHAVGKASITCGLEGISGRLRRYLHKSLDDQELKNSLSILIRAPLRELKIFLIATGKETVEDFTEFCTFLAYIKKVISMAGRKPRIIFSMTPLVRFPYTPLECEDAPEAALCREVVLQTERFVNSRGFEFRDSADSNDYYLSQMLIRAQDKRIITAIYTAVVQSGFVYYREVTTELLQAIESELKRAKLKPADAMKGLSPETIDNRPVKINIKDTFLVEQAQAAETFTDKGFCMGDSDVAGSCHSCGACESEQDIAAITELRNPRSLSIDALRKRVKDRQESISISFKMDIPAARRGIPRKNTGIALARAMMLSDKRLVVSFLSYGGSYVNNTFETPWIYGDDIISLNFHKSSQSLLDELCGHKEFIDAVNCNLGSWGAIKEVDKGCDRKTQLLFESPYVFDGAAYFKKFSIKNVTRKTEAGQYNFEITKDALKKKILGECSSELVESGYLVRVLALEKFNFYEFVANAFILSDPLENARIKTKCVIS
jgi:radical SAM superfamily enzyme YgiQ (UPF0313 family)